LKLKVRLFANYQGLTGAKEVELDVKPPATVGLMLNALFGKHPNLRSEVLDDAGGLKQFVSILVNGRDARHLMNEDTILHDGDEIALFPPVAGGIA